MSDSLNVLPQGANVAVIGAGISGLSFAYYLSQLRHDVKITILEKEPRAGGYIYSPAVLVPSSPKAKKDVEEDRKVILEKGPRTLRSVSDGTLMLLDLFKRTNHTDKIFGVTRASIANKKYLLNIDDTLTEVPPGQGFYTFWRFFHKNFLTKGLIWNILKEPFRKIKVSDEDESIESFLNRRFGVGLSDNIASAIYNGIYAGDVAKLSAKLAVPGMYNIEKQSKSSLILHGIKKLFSTLYRLVFGGKGNKNATEYGKLKNSVRYNAPTGASVSPLLEKYQMHFSLNNVKVLKKLISQFPILCFKDGLETVTRLLEKLVLESGNVEILYNVQIKEIALSDDGIVINYDNANGEEKLTNQTFEFVNSTISPINLAPLVKHSAHDKNTDAQQFSELLKQTTYARVLLTNIYIPGKDYLQKNPGFGYLIPKVYGKFHPDHEQILGVIFDSDMEKYRTLVFGNEEINNTVDELSNNIEQYKEALKENNEPVLLETERKIIDTDFRKLLSSSSSSSSPSFHHVKSNDENKSSNNTESSSSNSNDSNAQYTKITVMMGGHHWKSAQDIPSTGEALARVKRALTRNLGIDLDAIIAEAKLKDDEDMMPLVQTKLTSGGIPQYNVGYAEWQKRAIEVKREVFGNKLVLTGMNFNGGIGVPDCVSKGFEVALQISGVDSH